jgi:hypothetical protein
VSPSFRFVLLWIVGSSLLVVAALTMVPGALIDGQYIPSNPDAFYHARRILDVAMTGQPVLQFDQRIHYPTGSWITWPWGFDTFIAWALSWFGPFQNEADAAAVLMNLVVGAAPVAVALVVILARQLALSVPSAAMLVVGFAALPLVFLAFAVGNVDHHFAELIWTLLALCTGIWFLRSGRAWSAVVAGTVLGTAVAVHNGLFILQLPLLLAFAWRWLQGSPLPNQRSALACAGLLLGTTLSVSLVSEPWRQGLFEFYLLSWFHTYVAAATACFIVLFASLKLRPRNMVILVVLVVVATAPTLAVVDLAARFVSGELESFGGITEAFSPYELYRLFGPAQSTQLFSWLLWLAAPALGANAYWAWSVREPGRQFFALTSVLFLTLLQLQYRFGVFGVVPLLITLALTLDTITVRWPGGARLCRVAAALGLVAALYPTKNIWTTGRPPGGDPLYADVHPGLMQLRHACSERPGVVLAAINNGHWIRYHTQCTVIGNVFLVAEADAGKRREVEALLAMTPERLRSERPDIAYVLVHDELELFVPLGSDGRRGQGVVRWRRDSLPALPRALLTSPDHMPKGYGELWTSTTVDGKVFGRLVAIER